MVRKRKMVFKIPPEPVSLKEQWKEGLAKGGGRLNLARASIKQGTWLTTSLWNEYGWKEELKRRGITWQKFMSLYRDCYHNFISWVDGTISWNQAISNFIREVERQQ
jgi:hypothetical protein